MTDNSEHRKKLIKQIKKLQQSDFIYGKLLEDQNDHMLKLIENQNTSQHEQSFVKLTGDKIKDKLSHKLESIDYDLNYVKEELDSIINVLHEMKDANSMMEN